MKVSAKVDYAVRALLMLADAPGPLRIDGIVAGQQLPTKFAEAILGDLRRASCGHSGVPMAVTRWLGLHRG